MDKFMRRITWISALVFAFLVLVAFLSLLGVFSAPYIDPGM